MNTPDIKISDKYISSTQYNWTGGVDKQNKKVPGNIPEAIVKVIYNSNFESTATDKFSLVKITVKPGCQLNPVKFKTINSFFYFTNGNGILRLLDDKDQTLKEYEIKSECSFMLPPQIKHAIVNQSSTNLEGVLLNIPAWFEADEEFEWSLTKLDTENPTEKKEGS